MRWNGRARPWRLTALVGALTLGLVGAAGWAAGAASPAATRPAHVYVGPAGAAAGQQAVLTVTNLTKTERRVMLRFTGADGAVLEEKRPSVAPGNSARLFFVRQEYVDFLGRVSIPGGSASGWLVSLNVLDADDQLSVWDDSDIAHVVRRPLRTPLVHVDPAHGLRLHVANLGNAPASYLAGLYDESGKRVDMARIEGVPSGGLGIAVFRPGVNWFRVAVKGPEASMFIASVEYYDPETQRALQLQDCIVTS